MASLQHANATFTASPPLLTLAEPAPLLMPSALLAVCAPIGNRDPFDPQGLHRSFVLLRVEGRVGGYQLWAPPQSRLMLLHRAHQHFRITRPRRVHFVVGDNLMLRFLQLDQFAELRWLVRFPLADNLRLRLKHTHNLLFRLRHPFHHPRLRLPDHLLHALRHHLQLLLERLQRSSWSARQRLHFLLHPLRLIHDLPRHPQQLPILLPPLLFPRGPLLPARQRDGHHLLLHTPHPIPNSPLSSSQRPLDSLHRPGQHPRPVPQQAAVGRIVNVRLHHRRIYPHLPPFHHPPLLRHLHQSPINFLHHFWP